MGVVMTAGSPGLIGVETVRRATAAGYTATGTDNNIGTGPGELGHGFQGRC